MRTRRVKIGGRPAIYHLISRTVAGEKLLKPGDREVLRKQIRQMATFCGIEVLTYCILSNHFHLLVKAPPKRELSDKELVKRYAVLYGEEKANVLKENLHSSAERDRIRERLLNRLHDISFFMKELKMRFTIYYNKNHNRFGTLWAERFKSLLVESKGNRNAVLIVAAYIDLNPVRAGLCDDPKDYRFCGYAEATAGGVSARKGVSWIVDRADWRDALREYRMVLFGAGASKRRSNENSISPEKSREVLEKGGELPRAEMLRCRVRYFSDGLALGSAAFVRKVREIALGDTPESATNAKLPVSEDADLYVARRQKSIRGTRASGSE